MTGSCEHTHETFVSLKGGEILVAYDMRWELWTGKFWFYCNYAIAYTF
jgi:hypothetical protein